LFLNRLVKGPMDPALSIREGANNVPADQKPDQAGSRTRPEAGLDRLQTGPEARPDWKPDWTGNRTGPEAGPDRKPDRTGSRT